MRTVENTQMHFGEIAIAQIEIDSKSRDDIPAVLKGLQHIYTNPPLRERVFALLLEQVRPGVDLKVGRPGMDLWRIFVLAVLKQGLGCDFDRLQELANQHQTVRQMLGHGDGFRKDQTSYYQLQTLIDNVSLLGPQLLSQIGQVIVQSGHEVARKKPGAPLHGRCDSFVVETDVHYPTDIGLLYDSMRCVIRETTRAAQKCGLGGWRQHQHLERGVRKRFNRVRDSRRWHNTRKVKDYVQYCRLIADRAQATVAQLEQCDGPPILAVLMMEHYLGHAWRQMDQVERRLLNGESIAHQEKVFSVFEEHTRWISKGKAGVAVELGVPVCIVEDQFQFIVHHRILWQGGDVDVAVPMVEETQARFSDFRMCSFDRGFHSPNNRRRLDQMLDVNALPQKGYLSKADQLREQEPGWIAARRQHPAVESAINNLEHRGLERIRSHGADGFERTVALSVLAANLHRIGLLLQRRERERIRRQKKVRLRAA